MFAELKESVLVIVHSPYSLLGLIFISFIESAFFPIPPDTLMIPLSLLNPPMAYTYALLTTISSVAGGFLGYAIGNKGGKPIVRRIISDHKMQRVRALYQKYDVWAVTMGAFTPLPYKVFTIAAGLMDLNLRRFALASFIGRGGRFFAVATIIFLFGETAQHILSEYFEVAVITMSILLIGSIALANTILSSKSRQPSEIVEKRSEQPL